MPAASCSCRATGPSALRRGGAPAHSANTAADGAGATHAAEVNLADTLVVLDTCVLMPPRLSDVLMDLRARQLFSLHWSDDIEAEYVRNMQSVLGFPKASVLRRLAAMQRCCPEWRVMFSDIDLAAVPSEVDSKDRHVAVAALALRRYADEEAAPETPCDVILVTDNTADLAEAPMARSGVTVMRPGVFLDLLCDSHRAETEEAVLQAVREWTRRTEAGGEGAPGLHTG